MNPIVHSIAYSLADQDFRTTSSVGIWNFSMGLGGRLAAQSSPGAFTAMVNTAQNPTVRQWPKTQVSVHDGATKSRLGRLWWDQFGVYRAAARSRAEWLFLPKGFPSFLARCPVKLAVCCHDTMGEHYRRNHPRVLPRFHNAYFGRSLRSALRSAQIVFTVSQVTADQLAALAVEEGIAPGRIQVTGIGFERDAAITEPKDGSVVVLASKFPHKRTRQAVDFLDRWQKSIGFAPAVHWVGSFPEGVSLPPHGNWRAHRRLPETEFRGLMTRASVCVYFSEFEGFGMPPVEASLAGAASVHSRIPATVEVMGGCGFSFSNDDYESFRSAMNGAIVPSSGRAVGWAEELLEKHSWERVTERVVAALNA